MRSALIRYRWTSWLAAVALAFQALALVLQTPMEIARALGATVVQAEHCETEGQLASHHGSPAQPDDICSLCLGMLVAGHGVAPVAPALPIPVATPEPTAVAAAADDPGLARRTPQNPRAPPLPV